MAITFVAAGTAGSAASGNITITLPALQAGDLILVAVCAQDNVVLSFPADYQVEVAQNNGAACRVTVAWKIADGTETTVAVTHTAGANIVGNAAVYRGVCVVGDSIDSSLAASNAGFVGTAIIPTDPNCMIVWVVGIQANTSIAAPYRALDPVTLSQRFNNSTGAGGNTTIIMLADGPKSQEMCSTTGVPRAAGTGTNVAVTLALRPDPKILMNSLQIARNGFPSVFTATPA